MECSCHWIWLTLLNHPLRYSSNAASSINPSWIFPTGRIASPSDLPKCLICTSLKCRYSSFSTFVHMISTLTCLWDPWDQSYLWVIFSFFFCIIPHTVPTLLWMLKKYLLREYMKNEKRISNSIKVTYKSIRGTGKEPDYIYNMKYRAKHPYFWKYLYFL